MSFHSQMKKCLQTDNIELWQRCRKWRLPHCWGRCRLLEDNWLCLGSFSALHTCAVIHPSRTPSPENIKKCLQACSLQNCLQLQTMKTSQMFIKWKQVQLQDIHTVPLLRIKYGRMFKIHGHEKESQPQKFI